MFDNVFQSISGTAWAITPEKMDEILSFLDVRQHGRLSAEQIDAAMNRKATKFTNIKGNIAILPLYGVISQKMNMMSQYSGGTSTELFGQWFDAAIADPSIGAIIIDTDSPGGNVYGVQELSKKIFDARGKKPISAVVNSLMASAAVWIASAADEITVTPGGEIGSIGVLSVHTDVSKAQDAAGYKTTIIKAGKYKAEGNPYEPLDADAVEAIQGRINSYYEAFTSDMARNRNKSKSEGKFGEGRVFGAKDAVEMGLADRVGTLEQVIKDMLAKTGGKSSRLAQAELDMLKL